jgi:hypothetical protein
LIKFTLNFVIIETMKRHQGILSSRNHVPALIEPDDSSFHVDGTPPTKRARHHASRCHPKSSLDVLLMAIENVSPDLMDDQSDHHLDDESDDHDSGSNNEVVVDCVPSMTHEADRPCVHACGASVATATTCDASSSTDASTVIGTATSSSHSHSHSHRQAGTMSVGCLPPITSPFASPWRMGRPLMAPPRLPSGLRPGQILQRS